MKDFIRILQANKQYREIIRQLLDGNDCTVNGLWGSSASFFIAALASEQLKATKTHPRLLMVVPSVEEAEDDVEDLKTFLNGHANLFPASENIFTKNYENEGDVLAQRLHILNQILYNDIQDSSKFDIVVTPIQALLQPVPSPGFHLLKKPVHYTLQNIPLRTSSLVCYYLPTPSRYSPFAMKGALGGGFSMIIRLKQSYR